jgi:hypothetical protein
MGVIDFDGTVEEQLGDVVEPLVFNTHAHWSFNDLEWSSNQNKHQMPPFHTYTIHAIVKSTLFLQILGAFSLPYALPTCVPSFIHLSNS